jgi:pimeloyl-ACP methyl ester carboxylesterase
MALAEELAAGGALERRSFSANGFDLTAYLSPLEQCRGRNLHVYIEGDGLAWVSSSRISSDPSPVNPVALRLAVKDPAECRLYLARPGQYASGGSCSNSYWTGQRFAPEVVAAYQGVLGRIKAESGVASFRLIGFSGGGAVAALVAAQRDDISQLITVAGNLDTAFWTKKHRLTPLSGSLNPADFAAELGQVEQFHLIGAEDKNVGLEVFNAYLEHFPERSWIASRVIADFSHGCCWDEVWPEVLTGSEQE